MDGTTRIDVEGATGASFTSEVSLDTEQDDGAARRDHPVSELVMRKAPTHVTNTSIHTRDARGVA